MTPSIHCAQPALLVNELALRWCFCACVCVLDVQFDSPLAEREQERKGKRWSERRMNDASSSAKIILENVMLCNFVAIFDLHIITYCMQMGISTAFSTISKVVTLACLLAFVFMGSVRVALLLKLNNVSFTRAAPLLFVGLYVCSFFHFISDFQLTKWPLPTHLYSNPIHTHTNTHLFNG